MQQLLTLSRITASLPVLALLSLSGCGPSMFLLVHPNTGERITCHGHNTHPVIDAIQAGQCADQYEALGFVRAENLTAAQRATVSKPTAQRIEQEITIK